MSIRVIQAGMFSSIQDAGRNGFRASGIPGGGAMDQFSFRIANMLAGNDDSAACIEFTLHGASLIADEEMIIAFSGGGAELWINDLPAAKGRPYFIKPSTLLQVKADKNGYRSYLAVSGGFAANFDLGSRSTYLYAELGGIGGRLLKARDCLQIQDTAVFQKIRNRFQRTIAGSSVSHSGWGITGSVLHIPAILNIRVVPGPEWDLFEPAQSALLWENSFSVSDQANRMGYRMLGKTIHSTLPGEMISTAVTTGTIQVTHEGELVILMADAQTTGGYPRIGQIAAVDLKLSAQLKPGDKVIFSRISADEAEALFLEQETELMLLKEFVMMKYGA